MERRHPVDGVAAQDMGEAGEPSDHTPDCEPNVPGYPLSNQFISVLHPDFLDEGFETDSSNTSSLYTCRTDAGSSDDEDRMEDSEDEDAGLDLPLHHLWHRFETALCYVIGVVFPYTHLENVRSGALARVRTFVQSRLHGGPSLYNRLRIELMEFQKPGAERAPDYTQQGVSGLWGDMIMIENAAGCVLGYNPQDQASHRVFYGRKLNADPQGESREARPSYTFRIRNESRIGELAGKNVILWYDQDMRCKNKWPRHKWSRIPGAEDDFCKIGLLNPSKEWTPIGYGGDGRVVCEAVAFNGEKVAVKVVQIVDRSEDVSDRKFSETEARLLYSLDHPHLIACYGTFVQKKKEGTDLLIVMELADETLRNYLDKHAYTEQYLYEDEIWKIFIEVLLGLNFLHTCALRILHRNISSSGILRVRHRGKEGESDNVYHKLAGLGVARARRAQTESTRSTHHGKMHNFAPEQLLYWRGRCTEKTDVFQLGLIGHHCCFLRHPYTRQHKKNHIQRRIDRVDSRYSKDLHEVIHGCLHLTPEKRPSALELLANPIVRRKAAELGLDIPDPIAIVGLIKLDLDKSEIAVFNRGKLRLEYPGRSYLPAMVRRAMYPPVVTEHVRFGSSSFVFGMNGESWMAIRFKCVCVSKGHDRNLKLTLRHLSSISNFEDAFSYWYSPVNIYLNGMIVSEEFQPMYWRDYVEDTFELPSDGVFWDGSVNVVQIQLSKNAKTNYWLQGCVLEIRRKLLDVKDLTDVTRDDAMSELIWVLTTSACIIMAVTVYLTCLVLRGAQRMGDLSSN